MVSLNSSVLNLVAKSPFSVLQKHMNMINRCVKQMKPFFDHASAQRWDEAEKIYKEICRFEEAADDIKMDLHLYLHKDLFLPVSRLQLLSLLRQQDDIADLTQDIAGVVLGRRLVILPFLKEPFNNFVSRTDDACRQAYISVRELHDLVESGFGKNIINFMNDFIKKLYDIEDETDRMQVGLRHLIHQHEPEILPMDAVFLYSTVEKIGMLADAAQEVGEQLLLLISR